MASPLSTEKLGAKLGPLPVWAWGLTAGGLIVAGRWVLTRRAGGTEAPASSAVTPESLAGAVPVTASTAEGVGTYTPGPGTSFEAADPSAWNPSSLSPQTETAAGPADNQEWRSIAERWLIATGYQPLIIGQAMDKYFSGGTLTTEQTRIVNAALRQFGPPPASPPAVEGYDSDQPTASTQPVVETPAPVPTVAPPPAVTTPTVTRTDYARDRHDQNQQQLVQLHMLDAKNREGRTITYDQATAELDAFFLSLK